MAGERDPLEVVLGELRGMREEFNKRFDSLVTRSELDRALRSTDDDVRQLREGLAAQVRESAAEHQRLHDRVSNEASARRAALEEERKAREQVEAEQRKQRSQRVLGFVMAGVSALLSLGVALAAWSIQQGLGG